MKRLRKPDGTATCAFCRAPFTLEPGQWGIKSRTHGAETRFCPPCRSLLATALTVVEQASIAEKQVMFDELLIPSGARSFLIRQNKGSRTWED